MYGKYEEIAIGKPVIILKRWHEVGKPNNPPKIEKINARIEKLLFAVEIEQSSINRKSRIGKHKDTGKSFVFSDAKAEAWHQESQYKVMQAMRENGIKPNEHEFYAVLILIHTHYKKSTSKKNPRKEISSDIIDVGNMEKNVQDMLKDILYYDDEINMNIESRYSSITKDYMTKEVTIRKRKNGVMISKTRNVAVKLATIKVYQVSPEN